MMCTLYTYRNLEELRKIQAEQDVYPFVFADTKELLEASPKVCVDITALIYLLQTNQNNIQPVYVNFSDMTDDTKVIVKESLAELALELLPFLFSESESYYVHEAETVEPVKHNPCVRNKVYRYNNSDELNKIIEYANKNDIPIATFSRANGDFRKQFEQFNSTTALAIMDLTSVSYAIEDNKNLIYVLEQFLGAFPNLKIICKTAQVDAVLKYFPLFFDCQAPVSEIIPELSDIGIEEKTETEVKRITDLSGTFLDDYIEKFNHNLIGHKYFKERFEYALRNFIALNKAKEQKVLSIFLFGASGIGKTEVARLLANGLKENCYLAKINFQNYSSQDALNSLIGSPSGYIGCDHGELSDKVKKSKVGVLLCDEFEKTNRPVFSYFLELLEEGRFTDSMAREYDMDGYIIVFTSNLPNETEYKKAIPPELQTRFDLVCEFEEPTPSEKVDFLDLLLEKAQEKYPDQFAAITLTEEDKMHLYDFDYTDLSALRDIKRVFNNRLIDFFRNKGVL